MNAAQTVAEAARQAQCTQAGIRRIRKGEVKGYSVEELAELARSFGSRVSVSIEVPKSSAQPLH